MAAPERIRAWWPGPKCGPALLDDGRIARAPDAIAPHLDTTAVTVGARAIAEAAGTRR